MVPALVAARSRSGGGPVSAVWHRTATGPPGDAGPYSVDSLTHCERDRQVGKGQRKRDTVDIHSPLSAGYGDRCLRGRRRRCVRVALVSHLRNQHGSGYAAGRCRVGYRLQFLAALAAAGATQAPL